MEVPCIGSFLLEDDDDDGIASDFESHLSVLRQLSKQWNRPRLLLEGPAPIASSLILDLGMSLAANEPCRCGNRVHQQCENCLAVAILRPFDDPDEDTFPMLCYRRSSENRSTFGDRSSTLFHRKQSLQRIQINRFANSYDLLHYLLTMAGRPNHQQPLAGIFIDQLDRLVASEQDSMEDATSDAMRKSQIVAILLDTAMFMERQYGRSPMILVSIGDQSNSTVIPLQSFSSFWSPLSLDIITLDVNEPLTSDKDGDQQVSGQFALYCSHVKEPVAEISELRNADNKKHLEWTLT